MLPKQQIEEAEAAALELSNGQSPMANVAEPKLAATLVLELAAAQELGVAIQHLERGDRPAARGNINNAINHLNEAELE